MRYIGKEFSFLDNKNELSPSIESEKFVNDAIIEIFSRVRVLLFENLSNTEIETIKNICDKSLGYTEQSALEFIEGLEKKENGVSISQNHLENTLRCLKELCLRHNIFLDSIILSTVTLRVKTSKQPVCGYISVNCFKMQKFFDKRKLYIYENIPVYIIGRCVDYLTRYLTDYDKYKAFEISLLGLSQMPEKLRKKIGFFESEENVLNDIKGLDDISIKRACLLCCFDNYYREGALSYNDFNVSSVIPDEKTIENIRTMVNRTLLFMDKCGKITDYGFAFDGGYTLKIRKGDGDYLTNDTLWDLKVSTKSLNINWTLQLMLYWILGQHSQNERFKGINKIGIFNPRKNVAYIANISEISKDIIHDIEDDIIGYEREISFDKESIELNLRRAERIKSRIKQLLERNQIKKDRYTFEENGKAIIKYLRKK